MVMKNLRFAVYCGNLGNNLRLVVKHARVLRLIYRSVPISAHISRPYGNITSVATNFENKERNGRYPESSFPQALKNFSRSKLWL